MRAGHASIAEGALAVAAAVAAAAVFCLRVEMGGRPLSVVEVVAPIDGGGGGGSSALQASVSASTAG